VEGVVKLCAEDEVESLIDLCILGQRKVHVFVVRSPKPKNARPFARVAVHSGAARAPSCRFEIRQRLKCGYVEKRPLARIEIIGILQEGMHSRNEPRQAPLSGVSGKALPRTDPQRSTLRVANDRADLPATNQAIQAAVVIQIGFALAQRQLVHESCRERLRNVVGRQRAIALLLKRRRSEERRVGKECRSRWSRYRSKKKERGWI